MNKVFLSIGLMGVMLLGSTGCSKFLDTANPSYTTEDLYKTKTGIDKLLIDIYSKLRNHYNTGQLQYWGTDIYMAAEDNPDSKMFNAYDKSFNSTAGIVGGYWNNLYKMVQEANMLLARIKPDMEGMNTASYNATVAETKFLRALAYYYLVETFGPVPLLTTETTDPITTVERTSETAIYDFLVAELKAAQKVLPVKSTARGRVNDAAVNTLLGKVYLTRAYKSFKQSTDFTNAAAAFDAVINDPEHVYDLLPVFEDVFNENNQNNREIIFAVQYSADKNFTGGGNPQQGYFGFCITCFYPDMFSEVQKDYSYMQRQFWVNPKAHELYSNPSIDARYEATFQRTFTINNPENSNTGKTGLYFPVWNDESGDQHNAAIFIPFKDEEGNYLWYPQAAGYKDLAKGTDKMPVVKKFKDTKMQWQGPGTREAVVYRMGDLYLLSAEAHLGAGNNGIALQRVNAIRRRAAANDNVRTQMEFGTLDLNIILDERARELMGEYDRWFDLKRTGKLIERTLAYNPQAKSAGNLNANHLLRPIPQDEINKLKGLGQNTGY
ncbi:RagB/SusD family nutrient uptake outer membrane protein [Chitinophaga silvatica]|uniref:RagB/SusD family nutrient uptake outer membrane protein n=1 Tax=Chitinophaga silvatica TaxID=2282649 RepID=A0A3E1Y6Q7_9BACT|nr:RagB/SusD family nutrient uptake outer membrane protein [Chitinophaga silvatica]RFS20237.1 RagB/SusD family nutrient uptake outer membrane protein [Chitinophaga silvatica]